MQTRGKIITLGSMAVSMVVLASCGRGGGPESEKAQVPALLEALKSPDVEKRRIAATALASLGPQVAKDPKVVEALEAALKAEQDAGVKIKIQQALGQIDPKNRFAPKPRFPERL